MSAAVHHHRDVRRWATLIAAVVVLLSAAVLFWPSPSARAEGGWRPGWCRQGEGMTVVVDFSSAPASQWPSVPGNEFEGYVVRCVIGDPSDLTGDMATKGLTAAGIPFRGPGFVTQIFGYSPPAGWLRGTGTPEGGWDKQDWMMTSSYKIDGFQFFALSTQEVPVAAPKFANPGGQGPTETPSTPGETGPSASQGTPSATPPTTSKPSPSKPTADPTATRTTTRPPTRPKPTAEATRGPSTRPSQTRARPLPTQATRPPTQQPLPGSPLPSSQASTPQTSSVPPSASSASSTSAAASRSPVASSSASATAPDSATPSSSSLQPVYGTEAPAASGTPLSEADGTSPWAWGGIFTVLLGSIGALIWRVRGTPPAPGAEE